MKLRIPALLLLCSLVWSTNAQDLPRKSPSAEVSQTIGLTEVTISYSRPAVNGRHIFGELVPFGEIWRTGANEATSIKFNSPVVIEGVTVNEGRYSVFTIPGEEVWTLILNSDTSLWGTNGYDAKNNVLEIKIPAKRDQGYAERLMFYFTDVTESAAYLNLAWADLVVRAEISVDLMPMVLENIDKAISENPEDSKVYLRAAVFFKDHQELGMAREYVDRSLDLDPDSWYAHYVKAEIFELELNCNDAFKEAQYAMKLGLQEAESQGKDFAYERMVQEKLVIYNSPECLAILKKNSNAVQEQQGEEEKKTEDPKEKKKKH